MRRDGCCILLTGYSGAGKTTLAIKLKSLLDEKNVPCEVLDGDMIRKDMSFDLGFSRRERLVNAKRVGFIAGMLSKHGVCVIVPMIAPYSESRQVVQRQVKNYIEVYVKCPLTTCERRDVKGLYKKAREGAIVNFTGIQDPYDEPCFPHVICETDRESVDESVEKILHVFKTDSFPLT